jgi:hypothetical protein
MQPTQVDLAHFSSHLKALKESESIDTFIGAMMTTQGAALVFFSHRYNKEMTVIVTSTETSKVMNEVELIL